MLVSTLNWHQLKKIFTKTFAKPDTFSWKVSWNQLIFHETRYFSRNQIFFMKPDNFSWKVSRNQIIFTKPDNFSWKVNWYHENFKCNAVALWSTNEQTFMLRYLSCNHEMFIWFRDIFYISWKPKLFSWKFSWNQIIKWWQFYATIASNIKCGCSLELPREGGSYVYLQSMFFAQNRKNSIHRQTQLLAV